VVSYILDNFGMSLILRTPSSLLSPLPTKGLLPISHGPVHGVIPDILARMIEAGSNYERNYCSQMLDGVMHKLTEARNLEMGIDQNCAPQHWTVLEKL
jgi:hypothetical protein